MLIIQLILYCLIFTCIVKAAVIGGAVNGLYFYHKPVQDRAIDKIWVGHSSFWILPGLEDMSFTRSWGDMFKKRIILSLIWVVGAALVAGLVVLIF